MMGKKIVIIHSQKVSEQDPVSDSIVLRGLFKDWPKSSIFQIYRTNESSHEGFCSKYYKLQTKDFFVGFIFYFLKGIVKSIQKKQKISDKTNSSINFKYRSGILDVIFQPVVRNRLKSFFDTTRPDLIYCQGYSLKIIILVLKLTRKYNIPYVVHPLDDWHCNRIKQSRIPYLNELVWNYYTRKFFKNASLRFAVNEKMAIEYKNRYKLDWLVLPIIVDVYPAISFYPEDILKWKKQESRNIAISYTGSLGGGRIETLKYFAKIIEQKEEIRLFVYTNHYNNETILKFKDCKNVLICPPVRSEYVVNICKFSDILLLAESFDYKEAVTNRFVLSSKVPIYTFSKKPIFLLGLSINGTIEDALEKKWGYCVSIKDEKIILKGIEELVINSNTYSNNAYSYWLDYLEPDKLRARFSNYIKEI